MNAFTHPITLKGTHATLEPLSPDHHDGLVEATRDGELWKLWYTSVPSPEGMSLEIDRRLTDGSLRDTVVFSIIAAEWPAVKRHLTFKLGR
jgi:N-acetyltransferase